MTSIVNTDDNMLISSPYKNIIQYGKIQLEPYQLNSDIEDNILQQLKKKYYKKCNKYGFIDDIYSIEKFSDGIMLHENLSGKVTVNVDFTCRFCIPIENTIIVCQIRNINSDLIISINGPIIIFISKNNIDTNIWDNTEETYHKQTNKKLSQNDYVKILILKHRINESDTQIKCIGKLLDYSSEEEINNNFNKTNLIQDNFIV